MKKPINEIERLKLIAGLINEIDYNNAVYGVKKNTLTEGKKEVKELHIDVANPYEYRHGLQHELEQMDDYSNEALEKAKSIVLKNLAKDKNFYSNLLNADQSSFTFKATETDAKGMQAKADGHLKKELKKDEKSNVQDSLGKKEEGSKKPKGIKIMPDKGVEGKEKVVKEGLKGKFDSDDNIYTYDHLINTDSPNKEQLAKVKAAIEADKEELKKKGKKVKQVKGDTVPYLELIKEGSFMGGVDLGASFEKMKGEMSAEDEFESLVKKYDWYAEMSDDSRKWDAQQAMEAKLRQLAKTIGIDKAVEIFNRYAPSDRKVTSSDSMWMNEDKHAKIKEALKKALKEEDPAISKIEKDEEAAEKALAQILTKKAQILAKPGTQQ